MRLAWAPPVILALLTALASSAMASPTRMALVVGNNVADSPGRSLEDLDHAERDARRLRDALVNLGRFDPSAVELVVGGSRDDVLRAAARLAAHRARLQASLGPDVPTLFAFFFNGHGFEEQLLTADGALTGQDLAAIFQDVGATVTLGLFDACHSGAMDVDALKVKGLRPTPGFNPSVALPTELLTTRGTMWLTSSRPDEVSYEDPKVGSLFTHHFIEAFTRAPRREAGVEFDDMWHYARRQTMAHAARYGRQQTPTRRISRLESSGPLYISFPVERSATLVLGPDIEGSWVVRSVGDGLVERLEKRAGQTVEAPVFPGQLQLGRPGLAPSWTVTVDAGDRLWLGGDGDPGGRPGFRSTRVRAKGVEPGAGLVWEQAAATRHLSLGLGGQWLPPGRPGGLGRLHVQGHHVADVLALDVTAGYGFDRFETEGLTATVHAPFVGAGIGWGLAGRYGRLDARLGLEAELTHIRYASGDRTHPTPAVDLGPVWWGRVADTPFIIAAALRASWSVGLARGDDTRAWDLSPVLRAAWVWSGAPE